MSLVEAIVTLALLSIVLLALAPLFTQSVNINASSNQTSIANSLAREKLEQLLLYPTTDPRLSVPVGATEQKYPKTGDPADLPAYWNPKTGETSTASTSPGAGWYEYPYERTYVVQPYVSSAIPTDPLTLVASTNGNESAPGAPAPYYEMKLVTVTVAPRSGPFPGLRRTTQSAFVRYRNALPN